MSLQIRTRMLARSADEPGRGASQLELLFDLTFVIAVASLAHQFAVAIGSGHALDALVPFLQVFFAIWWAWVNFTWFASAFDTDDAPFRLLTLVQMGGVLVLAAGVPAALDHDDYRAVTFGYAIMRVGLLAHWLRAAIEDPSNRGTALRYAVGITILQFAWLLRLALDDVGLLSDPARLAVFAALVLCELAVPVWAERRHSTSWHPHHIAERYGLFAIILFGESVFAASTGVERALASGGFSVPLVAVGAAALVLVFALWWIYFLQRPGDGLAIHRERSYVWGYGHYGILAALAAVGAGLEVAVEQTGHSVARVADRHRLRDRHPRRGVPPLDVGAPRADHAPAAAPAPIGAEQLSPDPPAPGLRRARRSGRGSRVDRDDLRLGGGRHAGARAAVARSGQRLGLTTKGASMSRHAARIARDHCLAPERVDAPISGGRYRSLFEDLAPLCVDEKALHDLGAPGGPWIALIGDPRNDVHLFTNQMVVAFINLHNRLVDRLRHDGSRSRTSSRRRGGRPPGTTST